MRQFNQWMCFVVCLFLLTMLSGCTLLQLPGQLIGGIFYLLGKLVDLAISMPKPPPGVFF